MVEIVCEYVERCDVDIDVFDVSVERWEDICCSGDVVKEEGVDD